MHFSYLSLPFHRVFLFNHNLQQAAKRVFNMSLYEPKLLITLIFEYLPKQRHIMIILQVCFDAINYGSCPLNDNVFESILLVQIRVHVLLHRFAGLFESLTLLVKLDFL
jgi:hypothetical protein